MIHKFKLKNRFDITLVLNKEAEEWWILSENHKEFIKGKFYQGGSALYQRTHHQFCVRSNEYELVIDCNDEVDDWESWSIFDVKKQAYIETAQGAI